MLSLDNEVSNAVRLLLLASSIAIICTQVSHAQVEKYLCKGECNVTRSRCNCTESCLDDKTCCSDYQQTCLVESSWVDDDCATAEQMTCPNGFDSSPLILFSIDGFKAEYLYRDLTPNIHKLASCGVHAPYMRSVYPTSTFPNHHSISTGLYPESHNIVGNSMYDHVKEEEFYIGSPNTFHPFWWGGEPIWVTTSKQGKKSATYFWVGSDVNITRYPDYYFTYNGSVPNEERMYQALDWLDMPVVDRPSLIVLYMDIVDHAGHVDGPDSPEVDTQLAIADQMISILMNGLKLRGLENCVNIIMLADHGMAHQSCDRLTYIDKYGVNMDEVSFYGGPYGRVGKSRDKTLWDKYDPKKIQNQLRCTHDVTHWQTFLKYDYMPKRFHYANNDRIEDVQIVMDDEWLVGGKTGTTSFCTGGMHGFDNEYRSMHALFASHGPGFKRGYNTTEPFENIEVYNLMTDLLELIPAPNNGTKGSLYNVMSNPSKMEAELAGVDEAVCPLPDDDSPSTLPDDLGCTICPGLSTEDANARLKLTIDEGNKTDARNMMYGRPHVRRPGNDSVLFCMLTQEDYTTAFDMDRKTAKYVAYTLTSKKRDMIKLSGCSRSDPRVYFGYQTGCSVYPADLSQAFLYPPELSNGDAMRDATINTNTAPMYEPAKKIWNYMSLVLAGWSSSYGGITVVAGPAFDYDYDGIVDDRETLMTNGRFIDGAPLPTHFFIVVTRCLNYDVGSVITSCAASPDEIDVISFIIPNYAVEPCHDDDATLSDWIPGTLFEHVARIRDVELLTGVSFFRIWTQSSTANQENRISSLRVKLRLPQFTSQWLGDFIEDAPPTSDTIEVTTSGGDLNWSYAFQKWALLIAVLSAFILQQ